MDVFSPNALSKMLCTNVNVYLKCCWPGSRSRSCSHWTSSKAASGIWHETTRNGPVVGKERLLWIRGESHLKSCSQILQ